jgi:hypothetical protein
VSATTMRIKPGMANRPKRRSSESSKLIVVSP